MCTAPCTRQFWRWSLGFGRLLHRRARGMRSEMRLEIPREVRAGTLLGFLLLSGVLLVKNDTQWL